MFFVKAPTRQSLQTVHGKFRENPDHLWCWDGFIKNNKTATFRVIYEKNPCSQGVPHQNLPVTIYIFFKTPCISWTKHPRGFIHIEVFRSRYSSVIFKWTVIFITLCSFAWWLSNHVTPSFSCNIEHSFAKIHCSIEHLWRKKGGVFLWKPLTL